MQFYKSDLLQYISGSISDTNLLKQLTELGLEVDQSKKEKLTSLALKLIDEREKYIGKTISELYDPETMPKGLENIHIEIDKEVDETYKIDEINTFDDNQRIQILFELYNDMQNELIK